VSICADAGVERPDRLLGQDEPRPLPLIGRFQVGVGLDLTPVGEFEARVGVLERGIGPGLHREHGGQTDHRHQHRSGRDADRRAVSPRPTPCPPRERFTPGGYRLVGRPPLNIFGQGSARRETVLGLGRHRLEADSLQRRVDRRVEVPGRFEVPPLDLAENLAEIIALERLAAGEKAIHRRAERVDVRPRPQPVEFAAGLFRAHVGRRAQGAARQRRGRPAPGGRDQCALAALLAGLDPAHRLGQPPVDHQRLAVLADDDIARLDVAVQDATAVRVVDRITDVGEPPQELAQLKRSAAGVFLE
jgi:hypothetical protein